MKILFFLLILSSALYADSGVSGKIVSGKGCSRKAMIWLSLDKENYKERLLLMHTEVPDLGTFSFYTKPGDYQLRGSDESGCQFLAKVSVKNSFEDVTVKLEKP